MRDDVFSTLDVARLLGTREWVIRYALRAGRVRAPEKTPSGDYLWRPADVRDLARLLDVPTPAVVRGNGKCDV